MRILTEKKEILASLLTTLGSIGFIGMMIISIIKKPTIPWIGCWLAYLALVLMALILMYRIEIGYSFLKNKSQSEYIFIVEQLVHPAIEKKSKYIKTIMIVGFFLTILVVRNPKIISFSIIGLIIGLMANYCWNVYANVFYFINTIKDIKKELYVIKVEDGEYAINWEGAFPNNPNIKGEFNPLLQKQGALSASEVNHLIIEKAKKIKLDLIEVAELKTFFSKVFNH